MSCPNIDRCPLYPRFTSASALEGWKRLYCQSSRHTSCARFCELESGSEPDKNLLPNGTHLPSLHSEEGDPVDDSSCRG